MTIIPIEIGAFGSVTKGLLKSSGGLGSQRTSGNHPSIIENGQIAEKCPGDLRRLAVTQNSSRKQSANVGEKKVSNE